MSPQYHSASCREGGLPPLARPAGAGFALGGLGGSAGGQENKCILSTDCILWLAPTATEPVDTGRAPSQHSGLPTIRDNTGGGHLGVRPPAPPDVPEATSPPAAPGSQGWTQSWGEGECSVWGLTCTRSCTVCARLGQMCGKARVGKKGRRQAGVGGQLLFMYMQRALSKCSYNERIEASTWGVCGGVGWGEVKVRVPPTCLLSGLGLIPPSQACWGLPGAQAPALLSYQSCYHNSSGLLPPGPCSYSFKWVWTPARGQGSRPCLHLKPRPSLGGPGPRPLRPLTRRARPLAAAREAARAAAAARRWRPGLARRCPGRERAGPPGPGAGAGSAA